MQIHSGYNWEKIIAWVISSWNCGMYCFAPIYGDGRVHVCRHTLDPADGIATCQIHQATNPSANIIIVCILLFAANTVCIYLRPNWKFPTVLGKHRDRVCSRQMQMRLEAEENTLNKPHPSSQTRRKESGGKKIRAEYHVLLAWSGHST